MTKRQRNALKRVYDTFFEGKCVICGFKLDKGKFPKDFPDEWKFCCLCKKIADYIGKGVIPHADKFKKVYAKITLVG